MAYKIQIDNEVRNATDDEAAVIDAQRQAGDAQALLAETAAAAKASARVKLKALGLTDAEIAALVG